MKPHTSPPAGNEPDLEDLPPSKSSLKRDMHALQDLGAQLVALSPEQLARVSLPERLAEAVADARRFTQRGAHKRQLQFIGKLMRGVDPEPIRAALAVFSGDSKEEIARLHRLEQMRERFLADEQVIGEIAQQWPHADLKALRDLRRSALREREQEKPPRAFRELFRQLRALDEPSAPNADTTDPMEDNDD